MARKKKTTRKKKKGEHRFPWLKILISLIILVVISSAAAGVYFLEKHVRHVNTVPKSTIPLELINVPDWAGKELLIQIAETAGGTKFSYNEALARQTAAKLNLMPWLYHVQVRLMYNALRVSADYRKPVARIKTRAHDYCLAWAWPNHLKENKDIVVLNYIPTPKIPIITIEGYSGSIGPSGSFTKREDLLAAMELLTALNKMDAGVCPDTPLLRRIASVNISNFNSRKSSGKPHITLTAKDGTEILWGAAPGQAAKYMEASESEKIATLYSFYAEHGTIEGIVKYIDLRPPQKTIPKVTHTD